MRFGRCDSLVHQQAYDFDLILFLRETESLNRLDKARRRDPFFLKMNALSVVKSTESGSRPSLIVELRTHQLSNAIASALRRNDQMLD